MAAAKSWRYLVLCGLAVLPAPTDAGAAAAIACEAPVVTGSTFVMTCTDAHQSAPLTLVMRGTVDDDIAKPTEIEILAAGVRQTLTLESDGVPLGALDQEALEAVDLNLDGYDDLKVMTATSAGPNSAYAFWLYRPATRTFERRPDLDDQLSGFDVVVDPKTKTLSLSARESCCAWSVDTYRWANDRLVHISNELSGALDLGDALADVASIQAFRETAPIFCATRIRIYDVAGRITQEAIETQGDPCDDEQDYRKRTKVVDRTVDGTKRNGATVDVYRNGVLLRRTVTYDPPKAP